VKSEAGNDHFHGASAEAKVTHDRSEAERDKMLAEYTGTAAMTPRKTRSARNIAMKLEEHRLRKFRRKVVER
jgi:hypothetical protein